MGKGIMWIKKRDSSHENYTEWDSSECGIYSAVCQSFSLEEWSKPGKDKTVSWRDWVSGGQCVGDGGRVHFFHSAHPVTSV